MTGACLRVRGGGIEPPWLLTASTSTAEISPNIENYWGVERQKAPECSQKRRIVAACRHNSEGRLLAITELLRAMADEWDRGNDLWVLFARLLHLSELVRAHGQGSK